MITKIYNLYTMKILVISKSVRDMSNCQDSFFLFFVTLPWLHLFSETVFIYIFTCLPLKFLGTCQYKDKVVCMWG